MSSGCKYVTKWTCDVCKVAEFNTFEEALKHEKGCKGASPSSTSNKSQVKSPKDKPKQDAAKKTKKKFVQMRWTCDVCKAKSFLDYDEACRHEAKCTAGKKTPNKGASVAVPEGKKSPSTAAAPVTASKLSTVMPSAANVSSLQTMALGYAPQDKQKLLPNQAIGPTPTSASKFQKQLPMLLLQPLLREYTDSKLFYQLSTFHVMILQQVDLFERRLINASNSSTLSRAAQFRCHCCHTTYPGPWSVWRFGNQLPQLIYSHLKSCAKINPDVLTGLDRAEYTRLKGKVSLYDFGKTFFLENGIKESQSGAELLILDENKEWIFNAKTRRGRWMESRRGRWMESDDTESKSAVASIQTKQVSTKVATPQNYVQMIPSPTTKKVSPNKKALTAISQSGVIPLIDGKHDEVTVNEFLRLAMSQLELKPCDVTPNGIYRLSVSCKHCSSNCRPSSFEHWFKCIYSLTHSHLLKSCSQIPHKTRKKLTQYKNNKMKTSGGIGLRVFCEYLNGVYGLLDMAVSGGRDSLPGLGISQKYVKGLVPSKKTTQKGKKHSLSEKKTSYAADAKKPKINQAHLMKPMLTLSLPPLKRHIDEEGTLCYLPPVEGVPLISSQSRVLSSKLSRYFWIILDQLEFFDSEPKTTTQPNSQKYIGLRCRNCSNDPKYRFLIKLTKLDGMSDDIKLIARTHISSCPCTQRHTLRELSSTSIYNKRNKGSVSLKEYCKHLAELYSMKEVRGKGIDGKENSVLGVVWDLCPSIPTGYSGKPSDPSLTKKKIPVTVSTVPVHNLMIGQPKPANVESREIMASASSRIILSDYSYILASQLEFVPVKRKILMQNKTARQRSREQTLIEGSNSLRSSPAPTDDIVTVVRCKRCFYAKNSSTIQTCVSNMSHQFYVHFRKCNHFPPELLAKLEECKVYQGMQKSPMLMSLAEYIRKVMCEIYTMKELEWNGVSGGIGFKAFNETKEKYGVKTDTDSRIDSTSNGADEFENVGGFTLPLLIDSLAQPCTTGLLDGIDKNKNEILQGGDRLVSPSEQVQTSSTTEAVPTPEKDSSRVGALVESKNETSDEKDADNQNLAGSEEVTSSKDAFVEDVEVKSPENANKMETPDEKDANEHDVADLDEVTSSKDVSMEDVEVKTPEGFFYENETPDEKNANEHDVADLDEVTSSKDVSMKDVEEKTPEDSNENEASDEKDANEHTVADSENVTSSEDVSMEDGEEKTPENIEEKTPEGANGKMQGIDEQNDLVTNSQLDDSNNLTEVSILEHAVSINNNESEEILKVERVQEEENKQTDRGDRVVVDSEGRTVEDLSYDDVMKLMEEDIIV